MENNQDFNTTDPLVGDDMPLDDGFSGNDSSQQFQSEQPTDDAEVKKIEGSSRKTIVNGIIAAVVVVFGAGIYLLQPDSKPPVQAAATPISQPVTVDPIAAENPNAEKGGLEELIPDNQVQEVAVGDAVPAVEGAVTLTQAASSETTSAPVAVNLDATKPAESKPVELAAGTKPVNGLPVTDACPDTCKLNEALNKLTEEVKAMSAKVNDIDARLTAHLDGADKEKHVTKVPKNAGDTAKVKSKPVKSVKKDKAHKKAEEKDTTDADLMDAIRLQAIESAKNANVSKEVKTVTRLSDDSLLIAVVPGRAFFQKRDGTRSDVSVGDVIEGCGEVMKIDAKKSEIETKRCLIQ